MISRKDSNDRIYKRYHSFQLANRKFVPRLRLKSSFLRLTCLESLLPVLFSWTFFLFFPTSSPGSSRFPIWRWKTRRTWERCCCFSFFLLDVDDDYLCQKKKTTTKKENIHFQRWTDGFENFFCGEVEGGGGVVTKVIKSYKEESAIFSHVKPKILRSHPPSPGDK